MSDKVVYLMRGLPSCGKSYTARRLAGDEGIVLETDEYFYSQVGDDPGVYSYDAALMPAARDWNHSRFERALAAGISPIVVDRGNGLNLETARYARAAVASGYQLKLAEPESDWWQELRVLLKYKHLTGEALDQWAHVLAEKSRKTHRVPATTIRRWMQNWRWNLTVDDIVRYNPES